MIAEYGTEFGIIFGTEGWTLNLNFKNSQIFLEIQFNLKILKIFEKSESFSSNVILKNYRPSR